MSKDLKRHLIFAIFHLYKSSKEKENRKMKEDEVQSDVEGD